MNKKTVGHFNMEWDFALGMSSCFDIKRDHRPDALQIAGIDDLHDLKYIIDDMIRRLNDNSRNSG